MPELAAAQYATRTDWELFEEEYPDYLMWLDEQQAEEMAELDYEYNRLKWRDEVDDNDDDALPF